MAYNLLGLRTSVRTKIKDSSYSASTIDEYIYDSISEIAGLFPFRWFQKVVDGSLTVGEYTYSQQLDHESTIKLVLIDPASPKNYMDITKYRMTNEDFFEMFSVPESLDNNRPVYWTEYGDQLYFNCPVDKSYTLRQFYQKIPTELISDTDVPELPITFKEAIVLGAAYRCEEERGNYDISGVLQNRFGDKTGDLMQRFANDTLTDADTVVMPTRRGYEV